MQNPGEATQVRSASAPSNLLSVVDRERFPPHRAFRFREDEGQTLSASGAEGDAPRGDDVTETVATITTAEPGGDAADSREDLGTPTKSLGDST
jgi:hypothetical protein